MSDIAAVVFDFDGVIVESVDLKNRAFGELFRDDYPDKVDEIVAFQLANSGASRLTKFPRIFAEILGLPFPEGELEQLDREFSRIVFEAVLACPLVAGAEELLERLAREHPLYVASATPEWELRRLVAGRGLAERFRGVYGAPKSKPEILSDLASELGVEARRLVFVGDTANDRAAASVAGVTFVGRVPPGAESPFPADQLVVRDLAELAREWPVELAT